MTPARRGLPRHLIAERRWQAARAAQEQRCRCGTVVLFGLDDDVCATTAMVEPRIIDVAEAEQLREQGRAIYFRDGGNRLWRLDDGINGSFVRHRLLAEHVCQESS